MNTGLLVEDCFSLSMTDVNHNIYRIRKIGVCIDPRRPDIDYWIDDGEDGLCLFVTVGGSEPQKILIEEFQMAFGCWREYLRCGCGERIVKMYLLPKGHEFKCKKCHGLRYFLTTFDHDSPHGKARYNFTRLDKLSRSRTAMGTIMYNGKFTKKFERFLRMSGRAGLKDVVNNADGLMNSIKSFQKQQ